MVLKVQAVPLSGLDYKDKPVGEIIFKYLGTQAAVEYYYE